MYGSSFIAQYEILIRLTSISMPLRLLTICAEYLELFWKNGAEKQVSAAGFLFRGRHKCHHCPFAENICKDTAHSCVIITKRHSVIFG